MKIIVLGVDGMLGHKMFQILREQCETYATCRGGFEFERFVSDNNLNRGLITTGIDVTDFSSVAEAIERVNPDVVINCIGVVKQRKEAYSSLLSIRLNSLFPHLLADKCQNMGIRLIHFSTDCVFSGNKGNYIESDLPDPPDLYGRSKLLGEVDYPCTLTLRTSIIGWELKNRLSLLEWFASQRGKVISGFTKAIYSGVSTSVISRLVRNIVVGYPNLSGIYHVSSKPISKYDLLNDLNKLLCFDINIEPDDQEKIDRSIDSTCFSNETGWKAPAWSDMLQELAAEWPLYENWR